MKAWGDRAACRGYDPELWFPHGSGSSEAAKNICAGCPVRAECLDYALALESRTEGPPYGIWGGLSAHERQRMLVAMSRRGRRAAKPLDPVVCAEIVASEEWGQRSRADPAGTGCVLLPSASRKGRIACFHVPGAPGRGSVGAHRVALAAALGRDISPVVQHMCGQPLCVNPNHLREAATSPWS